MLGLVFGHTVYAITTVLAAFMAGLGLGSYLFGRRAAAARIPPRLYGLLEIGDRRLLRCSCRCCCWLCRRCTCALQLLNVSYSAFSFVQFLLVLALLLLPTTLMGGTLPS